MFLILAKKKQPTVSLVIREVQRAVKNLHCKKLIAILFIFFFARIKQQERCNDAGREPLDMT